MLTNDIVSFEQLGPVSFTRKQGIFLSVLVPYSVWPVYEVRVLWQMPTKFVSTCIYMEINEKDENASLCMVLYISY